MEVRVFKFKFIKNNLKAKNKYFWSGRSGLVISLQCFDYFISLISVSERAAMLRIEYTLWIFADCISLVGAFESLILPLARYDLLLE